MPAAYLKVILQQFAAENWSVAVLLEGTDLDPKSLLQSDLAVSFDQTRKVLANASRMLGAGWYLSLANPEAMQSGARLHFLVG